MYAYYDGGGYIAPNNPTITLKRTSGCTFTNEEHSRVSFWTNGGLFEWLLSIDNKSHTPLLNPALDSAS